MVEEDAYARAGVNIAAGNQATELIKAAVQATHGPEVLKGIGAFGGLFDAESLKHMVHPVLVASTDGIGTKTKVAALLHRWDTIGQDLVNHCVNDILVQGARPLFFLDYVASSRLDPERIAEIVGGIALACGQAGCALLGGETAEMPGVYEAGEIDLVGTIVGVVEKEKIVDGSRIGPGDVLVGLASTGLHTNGFSLVRKALSGLDWNEPMKEIGQAPGAALLAIHRCYLEPVRKLMAAGVDVRGLAHITGGGLIDNLPRALPAGVGAVIRRGSWPELPIFRLIQRLGAVSDSEMFHVFNMGLGLVGVIPAEQVGLIHEALPDEEVYLVGEIVAGRPGVTILEG